MTEAGNVTIVELHSGLNVVKIWRILVDGVNRKLTVES
jgi:hypothetical protein